MRLFHRTLTNVLTSDMRSIAASYDRRSVPSQSVGCLVLGGKNAGVLCIDGQQRANALGSCFVCGPPPVRVFA